MTAIQFIILNSAPERKEYALPAALCGGERQKGEGQRPSPVRAGLFCSQPGPPARNLS